MLTEIEASAIAQGKNFSASEFASQIQEQAAELSKAFLSFCQTIWVVKSTANRKEWKEVRECLEWLPTTANRYANVAEFLTVVPVENIEGLDVQTMMAVSCEKYESVVEELVEQPLSVEEVRERMKSINQEKKKKPSIDGDVIRRDVNGDRYAQIPPVYDQNAVSSLMRQMELESKSAQTIAAEGLLLRERAILEMRGMEIPDQLSEALAQLSVSAERAEGIREASRGEGLALILPKEQVTVESFENTAWEEAQQQLAEYVEKQASEIVSVTGQQSAEIEQLLAEIKKCDECIAKFANPQDGTEHMIKRAAIEDKAKAEKQLAALCS